MIPVSNMSDTIVLECIEGKRPLPPKTIARVIQASIKRSVLVDMLRMS